MKKTIALFLAFVLMTASFTYIIANAESTDTETVISGNSETDPFDVSGSEYDTEPEEDPTEQEESEPEDDCESEIDTETDQESTEEQTTEPEEDTAAETDTELEEDTETETETETEKESETEEAVSEEDESSEEGSEEVSEAPHEHKIVFVYEIPPTCTETGVASHYECEECGARFYDEEGLTEITDDSELEIEATGHKWGEWKTVIEPGTLTPGMQRRLCENTPGETVLTITLDAGHGKYDNKGVVDGFYEGRMTFKLMTYLKEELEKYGGVVVYTTRQKMEDETPLAERGKMAAENGSDLFISIHSNWFSNEESCGVSVYRSFFRPESEELGALLGAAVTRVINKVTGITYMRNDGVPMTRTEKAQSPENGDGVTQDYYNVTRNSVKSEKCRYSYIIEHGFHSNRAECSFLMDEDNLQDLAKAEAKVIASYFRLNLKSEGSLNGRHADYREIAPTGSEYYPYNYDLPAGYCVDASKAYPGGTTVTVKELKGEEYDSVAEALPRYKCASAFEIKTTMLLWEIFPSGKIFVSFPYPDGKGNKSIGVISEDGKTRVMVTENDKTGAASIKLKETGVYVIYFYDVTDVLENDVNCDGSVDNKDVVTLFRFVSGGDEFVEKLVSDLDDDGEINNKDVVWLFRAMSVLKKQT
ncbi:MAG: N-acetylmuramoyl-L-alanine amidase [Clostridia bacterium]|nr:N-acetylmuramoyl-L-alanine amidase [Clostridia bacterium]